jgi:alkylation response protein AidB-like acyl-CoA dehydrogenase
VSAVFFQYTSEQQDFRASLRKLLEDRGALSLARAQLGDSHDAALWKMLGQDMGVLSLQVPEEFGGMGFSLVETSIVFAELGRTLAPVPVAPAIFAIEAISRLGSDDQKRQLLPDLVSGDRIAVLAASGSHDLDSGAGTVRAGQKGDSVVLDGRRNHVMYAHVADLLVVPAADADGVWLYVVEANAPGVTITGRDRAFDLTRPVSVVEFDGVAAVRLDASEQDLDGLLDVVRTLLAAEMTGAAEACLDMAVTYAKQRVQFNRAIGSFQAIKHRCSEMAVEIDAAQAAVAYATMVATEGSPELAAAAVLAKAHAADTFTFCAGWNIQVHGGIGFTWEHDAHLYLRRAKTDEALFGSSAYHRSLLADRVGI